MAMSLLDADQVTKSVYDATNQALNVNVVAQTAPSNTVEILDGNGGTDKVSVTAGKAILVDGSAATQPISGTVTVTQATGTNLHTVVDSSALPTGASTSALQTTANTSLTTIIADLTNGTQQTQVTNFPATQPVSGSVTVVQPTGTNLHTVIDSGTVTANAGTGNFTVVQTTGTNLHTVIDSGTTTVTQATGTNLHTVVDSGTINAKISTPVALTVTQAAITVGTAAVRLTVAGTAPASTRVLLAATPDNTSTATFYVGSSSVANSGANRGFQIVGGQPFVANNDAGDYYIISSTAAQTVYVMEQQ